MIEHTYYKDRPALQVSAPKLTALFLPEDGGKLVSLKDGTRELLQQREGAAYRRLLPESDYVNAECSGFDDMFPTIDPYTPTSGALAGIPYPDHGEVCRYPMQYQTDGQTLRFSFASVRFPVTFCKQISISPQGGLAIDYEITNHGEQPFECLWAAHCMLNAAPDAQIVTPYSENAPIRTMFGSQLSRVQTQPRQSNGESYKFYYTEPIPEGYCGYRYADGKTLMLRYPKETVKYLGVWLNNGSFEGMYNIALEPCTAPYDRPDAAAKAGCACVIPPQEKLCFRLCIELEAENA